MKQRIYNGHALEFFDDSNNKKAELKISGSDLILNPIDNNGTVIIGEAGTVNDIEVGAVGTAVDFTFLGGGTITSNGGTLTIGESGDTIDLSNTTLAAISASVFTGSFIGNGANIVGVVPDLSTYTGNVSIVGNLSVSGTTTTVNQTNLDVSDNIIGLNRGASSNSNDSGLIIERGSTGDNAAFLWDESADRFVVGLTTATASDSGNITLSSFSNFQANGITATGDIVAANAYITSKIYNTGDTDSYVSFDGADRITLHAGGTDILVATGSDNSITIPQYIIHSGDADTYFGFSANNQVLFHVGGGDRFIINSTGNVGIATTTTPHKLTVKGTISRTNSSDIQIINLAANNENAHIDLNISDGTQYGQIEVTTEGLEFDTVANRHMIFKKQGTEVMRIATNGSVGIGTSNGTVAKFVVEGADASSAFADYGIVAFENQQREGLSIGYNTAGNYTYFYSREVGVSSRGYRFTNKFMIEAGGNVGIGPQTTSNRLLHLSGSGTTIAALIECADGNQSSLDLKNSEGHFRLVNDGGELYVYDQSDSAERFRIDTSGNVGIGTNNPAHMLDVSGSLRLQGSGSFGIYLNGFTPASNATIQNTAGNTLTFTTTGGNTSTGMAYNFRNHSNTSLVSFNNNGNVGIGITSPSGALHVHSGDGGNFSLNTNHDDVLIEGSGNIGLQFLSPNSSYQYIAFGDPDSVNAGYIRYFHTNNEFVFRTNGNDVMDLDNSGNLTTTGGLTVGDSNADTAQIGLKHLLGYCENTDVDIGTEDVKSLPLATYQAVFFDYLVKNGTNLRAGTITAVHDGTNIKFNEVSTVDVGDTTDVKLTVIIDGSNMKLQATVLSNNWSVKANIRGIKV